MLSRVTHKLEAHTGKPFHVYNIEQGRSLITRGHSATSASDSVKVCVRFLTENIVEPVTC